MSLATITSVEQNGPGATLMLDAQGVGDVFAVALDEEGTARLALSLLRRLDQRAREQVLARAGAELDAYAGERVASLLRSEAESSSL